MDGGTPPTQHAGRFINLGSQEHTYLHGGHLEERLVRIQKKGKSATWGGCAGATWVMV
jgi:hypothetical protein